MLAVPAVKGIDVVPDAGAVAAASAEQHSELPAAESHDEAAAVNVHVCSLLSSVCIIFNSCSLRSFTKGIIVC